MHVPRDRPGCFTSVVPADVVRPFWDGARGCGNFQTPELEARTLALTPTCEGCARADRARAVRAGEIALSA